MEINENNKNSENGEKAQKENIFREAFSRALKRDLKIKECGLSTILIGSIGVILLIGGMLEFKGIISGEFPFLKPFLGVASFCVVFLVLVFFSIIIGVLYNAA